jgi:hypothetical protein
VYVSSEIVVVIVTIIIIFDSSSSTDLQIVVEMFGELSMWGPTVMKGFISLSSVPLSKNAKVVP